ncbi:MAG: hypothetical protein WCK03_02515 [Candidatus Taylorbacteria bacterium]
MKTDKLFLRKNFKYVLVLAALALIVYSMPTVRLALREINQYNSRMNEVVSVVSAQSQLAGALGAVLSSLPPQPTSCPLGYICIPSTMISTWCPPDHQCTPIKPAITSFSVFPQPINNIQ